MSFSVLLSVGYVKREDCTSFSFTLSECKCGYVEEGRLLYTTLVSSVPRDTAQICSVSFYWCAIFRVLLGEGVIDAMVRICWFTGENCG
jgi:hypothetical protein